ncbi:MAG: leucine-rich repeat protein, partial [Lachnospiraceae bacterium]|nr:leucine-rich repeat protein [Lachnospiraceae bacterium]
DLKEGLETIGREAFYGVAFGEKLSTRVVETGTLTIPSTVQRIEDLAFSDCTYLGTVIFADGDTEVLTIDGSSYYGAFSSCPELTTVILPERIKKLEINTFHDDPKLQTLYIPAGVTEIADNAISNCPKLTIYGVSGSAAETYAKQNKIPFKSKDNLNICLEVQSVMLTPSYIEEIGEDVIGKKIQLKAKVFPNTAQNKEVVFESADEAVVTVNKNGIVTIKGYGKTTITVTTVDGGKSAKCEAVILKEAKDERPDIIADCVLFPKNKTEYSAVYTGEQIRPVMTVSYQYKDDKGNTKTQKLKLNVDYTVSYSNNVNVGVDGKNPAKVTVTGIGEYKGEVTKNFTIMPKDIKGVALSPVGDIVYGNDPSVVVTDGTKELTKDDYTVELSTTGSANEDTESVLTVKGIGNYMGISKKSVKFNILKTETALQSIASESIRVEFKKLPAKGYTYNGKAQKPGIVVTDTTTGKKLSSSEYKVIYTDNVNAGKAKVWVIGVSKNGKGYYGRISEPLSFDINQKDFSKVSASLSGTIPKAGSIENIKQAINEALTVKDGKHVLSESEYTVDYGDITNITNTNAIRIGTKYPIKLKAKSGGNYVNISQKEKVVYIKFGQLNLASKTANISVHITDAGQNEIILSYNGARLVKDRDYTAVVTKDKKKDTYTVKIKAVKNSAYKGSRTVKNLTI